MVGPREHIARLKRERLARQGFVARDPSLEELEEQERERQRWDDYVVALRRERMGVIVNRARWAAARPDAREWEPWEQQVGEPPTMAARVADAEQRIAAIDAEIRRLIGDSLGLE